MSEDRIEPGEALSPLRSMFTLHYLPALVAVLATIMVAVYADWQNSRTAEATIRTSAVAELNRIRTRLEGQINGDIQRVHGLVATLTTEPQMSQQRFSQLAKLALADASQIRNIAAAPDLKVSLVYPLKGNEKALGLDYNKNAAQKKAALQTRNMRKVIVTGPVKLVQGGEGLIARFPVFSDEPGNRGKFWGILSAVIDLEKLYRDSGLRGEGLPISVAVSAISPESHAIRHFFGLPAVYENNPVQMTIALGHEVWVLAAVPKSGWQQSQAEIWRFRLALAFGGMLIISPMVWAGRLMEERHRHLRALQQREDDMKALSHRLEIALETSKIGVWEFDVVSSHLIWDDRMRDLYDVPADKPDATYEDWKRALHPDDFDAAAVEFETAIATDLQYHSEFRVVSRQGIVRNIRAIGTTYRDSKGNKKIVGVNWDVTEDIRLQADLRTAKGHADTQNRQLEQARLRMESAALHDALTGLPNRRYLDQIIVERSGEQRQYAGLTVLHIDLDRFKDINDTLGHAAGDQILKHAADTLQAHIFEGDFLARIGGDEFVIVSGGRHTSSDYDELALRLVDAISKPLDYQGHECRIGASIGIASRTKAVEKVDELLVNADIALYEAKRKGRNRVEKFTDTLRLVAVNTKKTADEILRGLEQNEFVAYFQPQFDAHTLEIVGLEALARWDHPTKGILAPDAFLKIAESLKMVASIDAVVLNQALLQQYRLAANGIDIPKISVNISAQRLRDETLFARLEQLSFRPGSLSFELLESISFDGEDGELIPQIDRLKKLGVDIEIDDFGTGYASIVTLLKLTPRRLKIDRQLIFPIVDSKAQQQLVSSIIDIGRSRGIEIVAEGVETMAHAAILRDLGCQTLQGYAFAKPLSPAALLKFAKERPWMNRRVQSRTG